MFGAYIRAALTVVIAVFTAALLEYVIPFFLPYVGPEDGLLYQSFDWLTEYAVMLMLAAVAAGVLARASVESSAGVR